MGSPQYTKVPDDQVGLEIAKDDVLVVYSGYATLSTKPESTRSTYETVLQGRAWKGIIGYQYPTDFMHLMNLSSAISKDTDFTDVQILCGSQTFNVHRVVLAA